MTLNSVVVRYGEIGTKSWRTRRWFEDILMNNIREALVSEEVPYKKIEAMHGRIIVWTARPAEATEVLRRVFGVVSLSPAMAVEAALEKINRTALKLFRRKKRDLGLEKPRFRVSARRITKEFPIKSPDLQKLVGEYVLENEEAVVDLRDYDVEIGIEVMEGKAYVFTDRIKGWGGLPIGTQGKVVALLSGGIDSPVAAFLMMKRGCEVIPVHIYSGEKSLEKVRKIWSVLRRYHYGGKTDLVVVRINRDTVHRKLREMKREKYMCLFCKYGMIEAADKVAKEMGAKGIVTGDSLGQVASQTLDNLMIVSRATDLPIYRPLIGMDKEEIVSIAKAIGTFELSSLPEDPCPYVPRHPIIRGSPGEFQKLRKALKERET